MALEHYKTQILLLHSEQSTLRNLSSGFNEHYSVHMATSGTEALNIFTETPVHVIVSAQDLPGMSGLDALREAKKRSPDTIGILLAGSNRDDGLEALVGDQDIFQIVRGPIEPDALRALVDSATKQARLMALTESANDTTANLDMPVTETIVMETDENGATIVSDGTGQMRALRPHKVAIAPEAGSSQVDILVLTKDEEFLATIKDSARGLHNVHHALTPTQALQAVRNHKVGVLVTDAAMVGPNIEILTQRLRQNQPRLVAVVAGRRDDGELLMDLINRGHVYRFLLKPVSPGRARLAIEASINHHLRAPKKAFKATPQATPKQKSAAKPAPAAIPKAQSKSSAQLQITSADSLARNSLDDAFADGDSFAQTITGIVASVREKLSGGKKPATAVAQSEPAAALQSPLRSRKSVSNVLRSPKIMGLTAAIIVAVAGIAWFALSPDAGPSMELASEGPHPAAPVDAAVVTPPDIESDILPKQAATPPVIEPAIPNDVITRARTASEAGQLVAPPGENAIELYVSALRASPGDPVATGELAAVVDRVFGLAESAILGQRDEDATTALQLLQLASPDNPRLPFLNAQLVQLQLRNTLSNARIAIREGRFDDAGGWLGRARELAGVDATEVTAVSYELSSARNEQLVSETQALAAAAKAEALALAEAEALALAEAEALALAEAEVEVEVAVAVAVARIAAQNRLDEQRRLADEARLLEQQAALAAADAATSLTASTDNAVPALAISAKTAAAVNAKAALPVTNATVELESVPISSLTQIKYVAPKYPRSARRRNVTGSVDISFTVQTNGEVTDIAVLASKPGKIFNEAAMNAIAQWSFEPTVENGRPVAKQTAVRISFDLQ